MKIETIKTLGWIPIIGIPFGFAYTISGNCERQSLYPVLNGLYSGASIAALIMALEYFKIISC